MYIKYRHNFAKSTDEDFMQIQKELAKEIVLKNKIEIDEIKVCAGVDLAYWKKRIKILEYVVLYLLILLHMK